MFSSVEIEIFFRANEHRDVAFDSTFQSVHSMITSNTSCNRIFTGDELPKSIEFVRLCCLHTHQSENIPYTNCLSNRSLARSQYFPVQLSEGSSTETFGCEGGDSQGTSSITWNIPNREFDGLWETLFYEDKVKLRLLSYALTSLQLAKKGVNPDIVCCNRLILLHGPPGTGKTTLCKALAQKLSIRMYKDFPSALFVEVNCHSLFSKWFSESGKLVAKMFSVIREYASDPQILVIVLIDEVESLTAARHASINSGEPSDAIRVVNAVLTQLDILRYFPNVFVLATSNLTKIIDPAFADRADMIQYVGPPGPQEIRLILISCLNELQRIGILPINTQDNSKIIVNECEGLSGRAVRKLPLMALTEWNEGGRNTEDGVVLTTEVFIDLLVKAARRLQINKKHVSNQSSNRN